MFEMHYAIDAEAIRSFLYFSGFVCNPFIAKGSKCRKQLLNLMTSGKRFMI